MKELPNGGGSIDLTKLQQEIAELRRLLSAQAAELQPTDEILIQVAERESRRIAQELHTNLCQHMVGTAFLARALADQAPSDGELSDRLQELSKLIGTSVQQMRTFNHGVDLAAGGTGLISALKALDGCTPARIKVVVDCPASIDIRDNQTALNLYRIAQEAVANAALHSRGSQVMVRLTDEEGVLTLSIDDDGDGKVDTLHAKAAMGIKLMRLRARAISASLRFETSAAGGISVKCSVSQRP